MLMDPLLTIGSLIAISLLALVAGWLFPVRQTLNQERITRNFHRLYPDAVINDFIVDQQGKTAIISLENSREIGLVIQLGDRIVCRRYKKSDPINWQLASNKLRLSFKEFTLPQIVMSFKTPDQVNKATSWLYDHQQLSSQKD